MTFGDLVKKGYRLVKSFALDTLSLMTGGIHGLLFWRTASGIEAAIRCDCGDCVAQKMLPFGIGDLLFRGRCERCQEHRECKVKLTSHAENAMTALKVGEMLEITP